MKRPAQAERTRLAWVPCITFSHSVANPTGGRTPIPARFHRPRYSTQFQTLTINNLLRYVHDAYMDTGLPGLVSGIPP